MTANGHQRLISGHVGMDAFHLPGQPTGPVRREDRIRGNPEQAHKLKNSIQVTP